MRVGKIIFNDNLVPNTDNNADVGTSSKKVKDIRIAGSAYFGTDAVGTSGGKLQINTADIATESYVQAQILWESSGGDIQLKTADDIDMQQKQMKAMVIENLTSDPSSPVNGQIWIRTDL